MHDNYEKSRPYGNKIRRMTSKTQRELVSLRSLTSASSHTVFENHEKFQDSAKLLRLKNGRNCDFGRKNSVSKYGAEMFCVESI